MHEINADVCISFFLAIRKMEHLLLILKYRTDESLADLQSYASCLIVDFFLISFSSEKEIFSNEVCVADKGALYFRFRLSSFSNPNEDFKILKIFLIIPLLPSLMQIEGCVVSLQDFPLCRCSLGLHPCNVR